MPYYFKLPHFYIDNVDDFLSNIGYLKPYLRVYDPKDILLFSSKNKNELKILSNFHQSSVPMPWMGHYFNSAEAMLFYTYLHDFFNNPKYDEEKTEALQFIIDSKYGKEVKINKLVNKLYVKMKKSVISEMGDEGWDLTDWEIACKIVKVKYDYCPEFKKLVDANKDKWFCENSYWERIPKPGVLEVTDKQSSLYGKYVGCNLTGIAIQKCLR